jgi:four helix bundle protein
MEKKNKKYLCLEDISAYKIAFNLANYVWGLVNKWNYFAKNTVGKQLIEAIDSISANIAEGFGRYFKKDKIKFYCYSVGSISECMNWLNKAKERNLLKQEEFTFISQELKKLPKEINSLIKFTKQKLKI